MTPSEKDIAEVWQAVADFRKSKFSKTRELVNLLDDEIDVNNQTINFVDRYLLCDISAAKFVISKLKINNEALIRAKARPPRMTHMFDDSRIRGVAPIESKESMNDSELRGERSIVFRMFNFFRR